MRCQRHVELQVLQFAPPLEEHQELVYPMLDTESIRRSTSICCSCEVLTWCMSGQEVELHKEVDEDTEEEEGGELEVGSRVYIKAPASAFMAFHPAEVESTPVW